MLRCCYLGSMGFHILIWHGFVAIEMGVFSEEVKRAAIKRESKLNFCFFCVANYRGNPWGDREGHCWKFENCLALKVERILFVLLTKLSELRYSHRQLNAKTPGAFISDLLSVTDTYTYFELGRSKCCKGPAELLTPIKPAAISSSSQHVRILIMNPNLSPSMTNALGDSIENLDYKDSQYNYFTSPKHPTHPTGLSINDPSDAALSALHALPLLHPLLEAHDAFLIACYSPHPLVQELKSRTRKPVILIIEASIAVAVQMLRVRLVQTNRHHLMERELSGNYEYDEADAIYGQVPERMSIITTTSARVPVFCKALSSSQPEMLGSRAALLCT